jgi:hypothetical protein
MDLLEGSQLMDQREIEVKVGRLFLGDQDLYGKVQLQLARGFKTTYRQDWQCRWYRPSSVVFEPSPRSVYQLVYQNIGKMKTNTRLHWQIERGLGERMLMLAELSDIFSPVRNKDGPAGFVNFIETLENNYSVYKVGSRNLDSNALLVVAPKCFHTAFVYSSSCYYGEQSSHENVTLQCAVSLLTVRIRHKATVTLAYVNASGDCSARSVTRGQ